MFSNEIIQRFHFFSKYNLHTLKQFESIINVNSKQLMSDIDRINRVLKKFDFNQIYISQNRIVTPQFNLNDLFVKMDNKLSDYIFQEERGDMIVLYLYFNQDYVSNVDLQQLLRVSKNSVLLDIKHLRSVFKNYKISLEYSRKRGYFLCGDALQLRVLLEKSIASLLSFEIGHLIIKYITNYANIDISFEEFVESINYISRQVKINFISDKSQELWYLLAILNKVSFPNDLVFQEEVFKESLNIDTVVFANNIVKTYPNLKKEEQFVLSRVLGCVNGNLSSAYNPKILKVMNEIIDLVKANTGVEFDDSFQFRKNLYSHLLPSYYRLIFDNRLINPYKDQIMLEYSALFYLVKKSLKPLEKLSGKSISDDETAYFTVHFGGYLTVKPKKSNTKLRALSVCPNGISSSLILTAELQQLFPNIIFNEVHQLNKIEDINKDTYDLIFSTVYIENLKPVYIVQPIMNSVEKALLKEKFYDDFRIEMGNLVSIEDIFSIIETYSIIENKKALKKDLYNYFIGDSKKVVREELSLMSFVKKSFIQQLDQVKDWKDAIYKASCPLLDQGYIENTYIDAMIESVNKSGSYIVLAPSVAVPHSSPENGVNKLGISLLQLANPVDFNLNEEFEEDKMVGLIFVLAPIDSVSHLKALQQLAELLDNETTIAEIISAKTKNEIINIIDRETSEEE